ncbi:hypothetical protein JOF53_007602 [Crossiella equi]|uniref:Uncharacterized protein n=1 Tax=Crossiella equi TaxID=130796 RepID=A0ABS5AQA3_9PSEU|nr:hypothetical protein [Crossiella equi]MBP2478730.1 hypothetical protein [Crossiella equi]
MSIQRIGVEFSHLEAARPQRAVEFEGARQWEHQVLFREPFVPAQSIVDGHPEAA